MDADLQHDERKIPEMLEALHASDAQVVIASRYVTGGGISDWDRTRAFMSRLATRVSRLVCRQSITDPMSGFFLIRAEALERCGHDDPPDLTFESGRQARCWLLDGQVQSRTLERSEVT